MEEEACNYDSNVNTQLGECTYVDGICETCVDGLIVDNDTDNDGVCDADEVDGCTDSSACNYDSSATDDDGSCYNNDLGCGCDQPAAEPFYDCDGNCLTDDDSDGICNEFEVPGCIDSTACNYNPEATDEGFCDYLGCAGCTDSTACNYDLTATDDDGSCTFPIDLFDLDYVDCLGACLNDADGDLVCDEDEPSSSVASAP
jgi:hypothetical protein